VTDPSFEAQNIGVWKNVGKGFITSNEETYDGSIGAKIAAPVGVFSLYQLVFFGLFWFVVIVVCRKVSILLFPMFTAR
jgi:hypothetical protein